MKFAGLLVDNLASLAIGRHRKAFVLDYLWIAVGKENDLVIESVRRTNPLVLILHQSQKRFHFLVDRCEMIGIQIADNLPRYIHIVLIVFRIAPQGYR